jgi:protein SCO1/2
MNTQRPFVFLLTAGWLALVPSASVRGQSSPEKLTGQVGFDQRLGEQVPLNAIFRDDSGRPLRLGDLFNQRPVLLVPVYYRCPLLCNQLLNGLARSLKPVSLVPGKDFELVAFSIDPLETTELAGQKKAAYLERYGRPDSQGGWHFLTGEAASIEALSRAIGFRYSFNPRTKLYTHAAGVVVATPEGRIARYFYGIDFSPRDLEAQIKEAGAGKVGSPIGRLLLLCYDYDAATGRYTLAIVRLLRILGSATALAVLAYVIVMLRRERKGRNAPPLPVEYGVAYRPRSKSKADFRHPRIEIKNFKSEHSL